jgi:hypothetical protein
VLHLPADFLGQSFAIIEGAHDCLRPIFVFAAIVPNASVLIVTVPGPVRVDDQLHAVAFDSGNFVLMVRAGNDATERCADRLGVPDLIFPWLPPAHDTLHLKSECGKLDATGRARIAANKLPRTQCCTQCRLNLKFHHAAFEQRILVKGGHRGQNLISIWARYRSLTTIPPLIRVLAILTRISFNIVAHETAP